MFSFSPLKYRHLKPPDLGLSPWQFSYRYLLVWVVFRSYYESSDLPSALSVIEEALARHPDLVSDDFINMAAELYITNRQYNKALQVGLCGKTFIAV